MLKRNLITRDGFTLIEMIVATAMTVIVIFGIAIVLVNPSESKQTLNVDTICTNVSSCVFMNQGNSVRMVLKFDEEQKEKLGSDVSVFAQLTDKEAGKNGCKQTKQVQV